MPSASLGELSRLASSTSRTLGSATLHTDSASGLQRGASTVLAQEGSVGLRMAASTALRRESSSAVRKVVPSPLARGASSSMAKRLQQVSGSQPTIDRLGSGLVIVTPGEWAALEHCERDAASPVVSRGSQQGLVAVQPVTRTDDPNAEARQQSATDLPSSFESGHQQLVILHPTEGARSRRVSFHVHSSPKQQDSSD